jgi:hypothetical protein
LQERGWTLGFAPTAVVWHHRRNSIKAYIKQQRGYAKAEALLADKWPEKYNRAGHVTWQGRLYGRGIVAPLFPRSRIYHGTWGSAPFQSIYEPGPGHWPALMLMPEWYFLLMFVGVLTALAASWTPLLWLSPLLAAGVLLTLLQAARGGVRARIHPEPRSRLRRLALQFLVAWLHFVQPAARLLGRVQHGLGPWNWRVFVTVLPLPTVHSIWSDHWATIESRLSQLNAIVKESKAAITVGGDFDPWDFTIHGGMLGSIRVVAMVEEHGNGRQLLRFRAWPKPPAAAFAVLFALATLAGLAGLDHAWIAAGSIGLTAAGLGILIYADCAIAMSYWRTAVDQYLHRKDSLSVVS